MYFYLAMAGLFALYAADLLALTIVSAIARAHELAHLLRARSHRRKHKRGPGRHAAQQQHDKAGTDADAEAAKAKAAAAAAQLPDLKLKEISLEPEKQQQQGPAEPALEPGPAGPHRPSSEGSSCSSPTTPAPANPEPQLRLATPSRAARALQAAHGRNEQAGSGGTGGSTRSSCGSVGQGAGGGGLGAGEAAGGGEAGGVQPRAPTPPEIQEEGDGSSASGFSGCSGSEQPHPEGHTRRSSSSGSSHKGAAHAQAPPPKCAAAAAAPAAGAAAAAAACPAAPPPPPKPTSHGSGLSSMGSSSSSMGGSSCLSMDSLVAAAEAGGAAAGGPAKPHQAAAALVAAKPGAGGTGGLRPGRRAITSLSPSPSDVSGSSTGVWVADIAGGLAPPSRFPMVLVQLPMFNEEAHAQLIVERACAMAWPRDRLLVQVLDDSTKAHVRELVDAAAARAMEAGHPVQVLRRTNRQGFKAGAMVEGLARVQHAGFKYVAIFDADFEPPVDFLEETIGPLEERPRLGFVQTRWVNPADSFLTWNQKVNLGWHFDVEQRARSYMGWFFNFNGTAGVWRIETIESSGGWQSDTVVEDMDLSLRAYLGGWDALYLPHVASVNEVPSTLSAYRTQQFRWLSGPMQIIVKAFWTIWTARDIGFLKRLNCYWFFLRYILFAVITLAVLAVPPVAMWLDPWEWAWPEIFFCASVNFALAVYLYVTPFSIAYLVFSVAVGYFKTWAMLSGLCGSKQSKKWKVTQKLGAGGGDAAKAPGLRGALSRLWARLRSVQPPYALELGLMAYYGFLAGMAFWMRNWFMGAYCAVMATIFLVLAWGDEFM